MIDQTATSFDVVLYEGAGAKSLDEELLFRSIQGLLERGYRVTRVQGKTAEPRMADPASSADTWVILGDFGGKPPQLEDAAGKKDFVTIDLHERELEEVWSEVDHFRGERPMNQPPSAQGARSWKPWFPVIDYDRCTNCMQCLSFCLFDVYGVDEAQKIQVKNQDNCKTNCPACSRVCPEVAILFPKYKAGPINGAPVSDADVNREKMKVDISALLGGDIYSNLRSRSEAAKTRFGKERSPDKALNERKRCLKKLQTDGIIPEEVLAELDLSNLPSPDEIQRRAKEAAQRAEAAKRAAAEMGS
ncbi:MAG: ferredoxin family protein [Verrucomicrobiota bacterium]